MGRTRPTANILFSMLLFGGAGLSPSFGCPLVTQILTQPGAAEKSFQAKLLEVSDLLQGMFYDTGFDQESAKANSSKALDKWMELYLEYYLAPPGQFAKHPHWAELMDSMTGPIQRVRKFAHEGNFPMGHVQLKVLQDMFTEFYGDPPKRHKIGGLNAVLHTLESLRYSVGEGAKIERERVARLTLLRGRYQIWREKQPKKLLQRTRIRRFESALDAALTAAKDPPKGGSAPQLLTLLRRAKRLGGETLAAYWGRPEVPLSEEEKKDQLATGPAPRSPEVSQGEPK